MLQYLLALPIPTVPASPYTCPPDSTGRTILPGHPVVYCMQPQHNPVIVEIFAKIISVFNAFECTFINTQAFFTLTIDGQMYFFTDQVANSRLVAQFFWLESNDVSISACADRNCNSRVDIGGVTIKVRKSTLRNYPYGEPTYDRSFRGVLDGNRPIYPPAHIPFFSNYHRVIYVSERKLHTDLQN